MSDHDTERSWVVAAQAGSAQVFGKLVTAHSQALRAFLRRLCGNHAEAEDLAQDSFVLAWEKIASFDPQRPFRPWLFGIAWRKYRERRRFWARLLARETRHAAERPPLPQSDPDAALDLAAAFAALPPEPRAALLLCLGQDFTHAEAAQALALPLGTVKSHVTRGREKLKALLGDEA